MFSVHFLVISSFQGVCSTAREHRNLKAILSCLALVQRTLYEVFSDYLRAKDNPMPPGTNKRTLKSLILQKGTLWSDLRTGVIWSAFLVLVRTLQAAFWINHSCLTIYWDQNLYYYNNLKKTKHCFFCVIFKRKCIIGYYMPIFGKLVHRFGKTLYLDVRI